MTNKEILDEISSIKSKLALIEDAIQENMNETKEGRFLNSKDEYRVRCIKFTGGRPDSVMVVNVKDGVRKDYYNAVISYDDGKTFIFLHEGKTYHFKKAYKDKNVYKYVSFRSGDSVNKLVIGHIYKINIGCMIHIFNGIGKEVCCLEGPYCVDDNTVFKLLHDDKIYYFEAVDYLGGLWLFKEIREQGVLKVNEHYKIYFKYDSNKQLHINIYDLKDDTLLANGKVTFLNSVGKDCCRVTAEVPDLGECSFNQIELDKWELIEIQGKCV